MTWHASTTARDAGLDAMAKKLNGGTLQVLDSMGGLLATLRFARTAFTAAEHGRCVAQAIEPDTNAAATGQAAGVKCLTKAGEWIFTGTAGTFDADAIFDAVDIHAGGTVSCSRFTLSMNSSE